MSETNPQDTAEPIIIKKYANRRLYNTETSCYVTLEDLRQMVKDDKAFTVRDAKTNDDLTRQVLTQIILEQELKGAATMPTDFLRGVIKMHDDQMGAMMQQYLDASMKSFASNQDVWQKYWDEGMATMQAANPMNQLEEVSKRNMEMLEQTMKAFNPASFFGGGNDKK